MKELKLIKYWIFDLDNTLIAGDSDFVPAAKLARREGLQFILDPLWQSVNDDLYEHIDGLQSGLPRPTGSAPAAQEPHLKDAE